MQDAYGLGDEPGENSAFRGNLKIIIFLFGSRMSSVYTQENTYLEKRKMILFIMLKLSCFIGWNSR